MIKTVLEGKLLAVEGGDGSGKSEQIKRLSARLSAEGYKVKAWDFPQYGGSYYGRMAGRMLRGEFGGLMSIHPILAAMVFANDRLSVREEIYEHLQGRGVALCNRYVDSNLAHGAAKFPDLDLGITYIGEIEELEYGENRLPVPEVSFYLSTDARLVRQMVLAKGERLYMAGGGGGDQAENDFEHQTKTREIYEFLCQTRGRFVKVECMNSVGGLEEIEVVHERIWKKIEERFFV